MSFGDTQHFWVVFEQISRSRCAPLSLLGRQQLPCFPDLDDTEQTHSITPIKTTAHWISFSQTTQCWRERTFFYMPGSWCPEKRVIWLIQSVVAGRVGRRSCHTDPLTLFSSVSVSLVGTLLFAQSISDTGFLTSRIWFLSLQKTCPDLLFYQSLFTISWPWIMHNLPKHLTGFPTTSSYAVICNLSSICLIPKALLCLTWWKVRRGPFSSCLRY